MGRDFWPIAYCSQAFTVPRTSFPQHQSSHRLLYHLSAASLTIPGPAPCPGAPACHPNPIYK